MLSFSDLPKTISGKFSVEWAIIQQKLVKTDELSLRSRNGLQNIELSSGYYDGNVDFNGIIEKCKTDKNTISVGFQGGIDELERRALKDLQARKYKWRYINPKSDEYSKNWIKGSAFLTAINELIARPPSSTDDS